MKMAPILAKTWIGALAVTACGVFAVPSLAMAAGEGTSSPKAECDAYVYYDITSSSDTHVRGKGLPVLKDGPGGTITGSVTVSSSVAATITVGGETELSGVIAKAKVSVSASVTANVGITAGHSYSRDIAKGKYGNMQYGSWGKKVNWKKQQSLANCSVKTLSSGSATLPTSSIGWKYWETSS